MRTLEDQRVIPFHANMSSVTYRLDEFFVELVRVNPEGEQERLQVYLSPIQAKALRDALALKIAQHEETFGEIPSLEIRESEEPKSDSFIYR